MQDHASAIFQRGELTDREALGMGVAEALRSETADGAKAYDATWLDRESVHVIANGFRVRVPAALHIAHFTAPEYL